MCVRRFCLSAGQCGKCQTGASDAGPHHFHFGYPGCVPRIFPGLQEYDAHVDLTDRGADSSCGSGAFDGKLMVHHFAGAGEDTLQRWSAAGATIGTGAGVTAALLFMLFVYSVNRKTINRRIARDKVSVDESYQQVMRNIVLIVAPIILSAFIYNVNGLYQWCDVHKHFRFQRDGQQPGEGAVRGVWIFHDADQYPPDTGKYGANLHDSGGLRPLCHR